MTNSATAPDATAAGPQCAAAVLMVRPAHFAANPETLATNRFQRPGPGPDAAAERVRARAEFDGVAARLELAGVRVHAFEDRAEVVCPDAVFPNNWVSFHADGTVVLYPMLAPSRRRERRLDLVAAVLARGRHSLTRLVDLSHFELRGQYLEGTGSLVLDRAGAVAYACLSPRTHREPLEEFAAETGHELVVFAACDRTGTPVYHTNVLLSIGRRHAAVCLDAVAPADRERLLESLGRGGREVLGFGLDALEHFAGNALELTGSGGRSVLAISRNGLEHLEPATRARLEACVDTVLPLDVPTIESCGGGSVRCMLAEVFLPAAAADRVEPERAA